MSNFNPKSKTNKQRKIIKSYVQSTFEQMLADATSRGWYQVGETKEEIGQYSALLEMDITTRTYKALKQQQQEFAQMQINLQELMNEVRNTLEEIEDDRKIEG